MASVRQEIVARYRGAITPKLHLLEEHIVNQMRYFGSGLGLLGEQGGAVRLQSRLQFIDRLGRPGLRNAKLIGFPPGCSFLDREHDLRKILIRQQIHSTKNFW